MKKKGQGLFVGDLSLIKIHSFRYLLLKSQSAKRINNLSKNNQIIKWKKNEKFYDKLVEIII